MRDVRPAEERRARHRLSVRWNLSLRKGPAGDRVCRTVTDNLSSRGFACVVEEALEAGDRLDCLLQFPAWMDRCSAPMIRCAAQVVWVKAREDGLYAIGCGINGYTLVAC
ncbi:MAG TPA: PilZ domain-containing protein [Bryobacteraceae bacterium]|nr:PilZ domain-containing protein [Bryobacteraceae bacterium]